MGFGYYGPGLVPKLSHGRNEKIRATFIPDLSIEIHNLKILLKLLDSTTEIRKIPAGKRGV
jgi:hypothetical protein